MLIMHMYIYMLPQEFLCLGDVLLNLLLVVCSKLHLCYWMKLLQQLLMKRPTGHPILVVNQRIAKFDVCYGISFIVIVSSSYCYDYTIRLLATAFFILVYWNHSVARCQTLHHYHLLVQGFYPFARSRTIKGNRIAYCKHIFYYWAFP